MVCSYVLFCCFLCLSTVPGDYFQFERQAFFVCDRIDSKPGKLIFNRTVNLKESKAAPAAAAASPAASAKPAKADAKQAAAAAAAKK
jgi:hypothetical protein